MIPFLVLALCSVVGVFATGLTVGIACERRRIRDSYPDVAPAVVPVPRTAAIPAPRASATPPRGTARATARKVTPAA